MSEIVVNRAGLPFVLGGATHLSVRLGALDPTAPLPGDVESLFEVAAGGGGAAPLDIGGPGACTVSLKAGTTASLKAIRPAGPLATEFGLAPFFASHPDTVALVLDVGGNADGTFDGTARYAALTATATLQAGTQARFAYVRAYPKAERLGDMVPDFFVHVRVPGLVTDAPAPGEVTRLEFGGYLKIGLQVGAGYQVKGTPSIEVGALQLSEHYALSVVGTVGLSAQVAGAFSVDVRGATRADGTPDEHWARVLVHRSRSDACSVAADVKVEATSELKGLPESPDEFLGALLGVNVENWLHVLERIETLSDLDSLEAELDRLGKQFVAAWVGKSVAALTTPEFTAVLARVKQVVDQYKGLENTVITAFDRYFNTLTGPALGGEIAKAFETIAHIPSWDSLQGTVDPLVWRLVNELTDGDPLAWMLTKEVSKLQRRAAHVLALVSDMAHADLRAVIALAKSQFGLDPLFAALDKLDTAEKLKAEANSRAGAFIERLTGQAIDALADSELEPLRKHVHEVAVKARAFERIAYKKFTDALRQTASFNLHAQYSRAGSRDALVDLAVNVATEEGRQLLRQCALGDFTRAIVGNRRDLVRINEGRFVHTVTRQSAVSVNVIGWHKAFNYSAMDRLIVEADQRLVTEPNGGVTAYTTLELDKLRDRKRNGERTLTNFVLRFAGESNGVLEADPANTQFLIGAITGMSARYQLTYTDTRTTAGELAYYVSFAKQLGLWQPALAFSALARMLPPVGPDNFGEVTAAYDVRYTEAGLKSLFAGLFDEARARKTIRRIVLACYLRRDAELRSVGWAYWTDGVRDIWNAGQGTFVKPDTQEYKPIAPSPFDRVQAPPSVQLGPDRQALLSTLYFVENRFVAGFAKLHELVSAGAAIAPSAFERALGDFGDALTSIDRFTMAENGAFAVFDDLQRQAGPGARQSSLTLDSTVSGTPVSKVFLTPAV